MHDYTSFVYPVYIYLFTFNYQNIIWVNNIKEDLI